MNIKKVRRCSFLYYDLISRFLRQLMMRSKLGIKLYRKVIIRRNTQRGNGVKKLSSCTKEYSFKE